MTHTPNDRGGGSSNESDSRELARVKLPDLYTVPAGTRAARCDCTRRIWFVMVDGKRLPITCTESFIDTKQHGRVMVPGVKPPTSTEPGIGFNHFIDCPNRRKHAKRDAERAAEPHDVAQRIDAAERCAEQHGLRCTGAPNLRDTCGGFGVVVFLISKRLFATPCSVHADAVLAAIKYAGRARDCLFFPVQDYLESEPERAVQFVAKATALRERNAREGFTVPRAGPLL